jgi:hypothetical protein
LLLKLAAAASMETVASAAAQAAKARSLLRRIVEFMRLIV